MGDPPLTRHRYLLTALVLLSLLTVGLDPVLASPYTTITSTGPLEGIDIGDDLSCQVDHVNDASFQFYHPSSQPGDCGTMLVVGSTLYAPDFASHATATTSLGSYVVYTPVSQTGVTGSGTTFSPYQIETVVAVGSTGLRIREVDQYVVGDDFYTTHVHIVNTGETSRGFILYRAGDCFLGGSDVGYGAVGVVVPDAVACTENANNSPAGRYINWEPMTPGSSYYHNSYNSVWAWIGGHTAFPDSCACTAYLDNGAGLSWTGAVGGGSSVSYSHRTRFSVPDSPPPPECEDREDPQCPPPPPPPLTPGARCEAIALRVAQQTATTSLDTHESRSRAGVLGQPGVYTAPLSPHPTPPPAPKAQADAAEDGVTITAPPVQLTASTVSSRCDVDAVFAGGSIHAHAYGRGSIEDLELRIASGPTLRLELLDFELDAVGTTMGTTSSHACDIVELDTLAGAPKELGVCKLTLPLPTAAIVGVQVVASSPWANAPALDAYGDWVYEGALARLQVTTSAPYPPTTTLIDIGYVRVAVTGGPAAPSAYVPNTGCTILCT